MSTIIRTSPPTFYDEEYKLEKPWLVTAAVSCMVALIYLGVVVVAYFISDSSIKTGVFLLIAIVTGVFQIGFSAYRTWTDSRTIIVDSVGLRYRFSRDKWRHMPIGSIRGWHVNRRKFFWLKNGSYYLEELIVELNNSARSARSGSSSHRVRIRTRRAFEAGQAIDRAKIFTNTMLEPAPRLGGTVVMDLELALTKFASVFSEKARP